jgi:hypothetical protein
MAKTARCIRVLSGFFVSYIQNGMARKNSVFIFWNDITFEREDFTVSNHASISLYIVHFSRNARLPFQSIAYQGKNFTYVLPDKIIALAPENCGYFAGCSMHFFLSIAFHHSEGVRLKVTRDSELAAPPAFHLHHRKEKKRFEEKLAAGTTIFFEQ